MYTGVKGESKVCVIVQRLDLGYCVIHDSRDVDVRVWCRYSDSAVRSQTDLSSGGGTFLTVPLLPLRFERRLVFSPT